jgi:hypothetical protein
MGIKASPTCVLSFGDEGKCKGWLLGELNRGMPQMFQMMNEARLGVGIQGLANAAAAYMSALGYSLERKQGSDISKFKDPQAPRVEIVMHPDVRRMLITMKAYVEGMRAMLYHTATYIDLAKHHADEEARELYNNLVELLTPVCKAYASDMGFRVCELAVQTYGGYGYTQEYPVELYLRDAKIASIYEGTNGIQAMDLFARKIGQNKGLRLMQFGKFVTKHIARWQEHALGELTMPLNRALNDLTEVSLDLLTAASSGDMVHGLLHATPYLEMFGNFATAFYLVEAAVIAHDKLHQLYAQEQLTTNEAQEKFLQQNSDAAFYHSKICTARFFIHHILSKNIGFAESIRAHDRSPIDVIFPNT